LALSPRQSGALEYVGRRLHQEGRFDEAVACWKSLLESEPENGRGLLGRALSHRARGDAVRAKEDARAACRLGEEQACALARTL
jgi:cytochrome c-type biogenesis protein CcmH/NrfG